MAGFGVSKDAPKRNRPKGGSNAVDPNVINLGNSKWQGDSYKNAAHAALNAVNQQRAAAGMGALGWNDNLAACAMIRATELQSSFSHTRPNGQDWYTVAPNIMYGENLAYGYSTPESAVSAWMASPTHKANILTPGFTTCGIGAYVIGSTWYWSQEFGY